MGQVNDRFPEVARLTRGKSRPAQRRWRRLEVQKLVGIAVSVTDDQVPFRVYTYRQWQTSDILSDHWRPTSEERYLAASFIDPSYLFGCS